MITIMMMMMFQSTILYFFVIWDDQHRNPTMNNKDHLVGQLTNDDDHLHTARILKSGQTVVIGGEMLKNRFGAFFVQNISGQKTFADQKSFADQKIFAGQNISGQKNSSQCRLTG